jgi:hypothetical protein
MHRTSAELRCCAENAPDQHSAHRITASTV